MRGTSPGEHNHMAGCQGESMACGLPARMPSEARHLKGGRDGGREGGGGGVKRDIYRRKVAWM
jgi:hypothetical protein